MAVTLTLPPTGLGFLSIELAPKGEKPKVPEMRFYLAYDLAGYYGVDSRGMSVAYSEFSGRRYHLAEGAICRTLVGIA
jgi:hypothetical protein